MTKSPSEEAFETRIARLERALARERALRDQTEQLLEDRSRDLYLADQHRRETDRTLAHAEKLGAIGRMAAGVAHEINNALNFMRGNVQLLPKYIRVYEDLLAAYRERLGAVAGTQEDLKALEQKHRLPYIEGDLPKLLQAIQTGLERATSIVHNLGVYSRKDSADAMELVDLRQVMSLALTLSASRLKNNAVVSVAESDIPSVRCHPGWMSQIYLNLLANAADAMSEQGHICISFRREGSDVVTVVADNGCGMSVEQQSHLFEPFHTTKAPGSGTGLGLYLCKQLVEQQGGSIKCISSPGHGTTFLVAIPVLGLSDSPREAVGLPGPQTSARPEEGKKEDRGINPADVISKSTITSLTRLLAKEVGPMARIYMKGELARLGLAPETVGVAAYKDLLKALAARLADPAKRNHFQTEARALLLRWRSRERS